MKIAGAKIEKPGQWIATNVAGIAIPVADLAGVDMPDALSTFGWVAAGTVIVRIAALIWLATATRNEEEMA